MRKVLSTVLVVSLVLTFFSFQGCEKKQEDVIKIGAILPLTGGASFIGQSIKNGLILAEAQKKDKIKLIIEDSQGNPKNGVSIYNKMKTQYGIKIFIPVFSGVTNALIPIANKNKDLLFATCVSSGNISQKSDNLFRLFVNANGDARKIANYAVDSLAMKKFYILYVNDDFGIDYKDTFIDEINKTTGSIVGTNSFERNENDFKNILNLLKAKSQNVNAVYLLGYDNNMGILLKQYYEANIHIPILSIATIGQPNVIKYIKDILNDFPDVYFTNTLLNAKGHSNKIKLDFLNKYNEKFNASPNYFAAFAYDLLNITAESISKSNPEDIKQYMINNNFSGVMGKINFDKYGDAQFPMIIEKLEK